MEQFIDTKDTSTKPQGSDSARIRLWVGIISFCVFCAIAFFVMTGRTEAFDEAAGRWVRSLRGPVTNIILITVTYLGNWQTIIGLMVVLVLVPATRRSLGIPAAITGTCGVILYKALKEIFRRPRPHISNHIIDQGGFSFPSGHSLSSVVCYGMLIFLLWRCVQKSEGRSVSGAGRPGAENYEEDPRDKDLVISRKIALGLTVFFVLLIFAIMFSRIFVGVHYITDVMAGASMGLTVLMGATLVWDRLDRRTPS